MELLGCAAPQTSGFSRQLYDAIPAGERKYLTATVLTMRWRLRNYIVSQQASDGTWRLYGREGDSPTDSVTTAFATAALFDDRGARIDAARAMAAHLDALPGSGPVSEAAVCYLWACSGIDVLDRVQQILNRSGQPTVARLAACWMLSLCHEHIASPASAEVRQALIAEVLKLVAEPWACAPLDRTLALQTLLTLHYRGEEIEDLFAPLLLDPIAPWEWKLEPFHDDVCCPSFNVVLLVSAIAKSLEGGAFSC
ncbi:prenyltransferase/squalene oxidase repeat-containing protein [Occallatibacter riparius]|uniref:Uncharacterized protein n=1 Tax=Occallatibacter riparius TaxID=1002689 RepID=A0A9J7BUT6_9BACT|nr:hypothetical protein [Occallatibacter riparius]UWZ85522.1 hypothetical protein MOP44_06165 [Occallatibacter riparius]